MKHEPANHLRARYVLAMGPGLREVGGADGGRVVMLPTETRMFTDQEESKIFSIAGRLLAGMKRLESSSTVFESDMTAKVDYFAMCEVASDIKSLTRLCVDAVARP